MAHSMICTDKKRSKGRPSLRTMTIRKGIKHATIMFSRKSGNDLQLVKGNKVDIIRRDNRFYLCPDSESGCTIKVARNGQGLETYRISNKDFVLMLLQGVNADSIAVVLISSMTKDIDGKTYFQLVKHALRTEKY